ncbi:MAG: late competence development ComFB family protein [Oscillospiraceae bacterium]|nr:late competence development ComFB family protein [Oscillospiraceae bacterium]
MAARSSKTSKTAHVMGLLNKTEIPDSVDEPISRPAPSAPPVHTAPPPPPPVYEQPPQGAPYAPQPYPQQAYPPQQQPYPQQPYPQPIVYAAPPPPPVAPAAPAAPPASVAIETGGDAASAAVRSALAEYFSLQESEAALSSAQAPAPVQSTVQPLTRQPAMQAPVLTAPPPPPPMPVTPYMPSSSTAFNMKGYDFVNVMQLIVERKAKKYMALFGVCECSKCFADVCAIALNNLPPKYAVHRSGDVASTVSVCEGRFEASAVAQVTKACRIVMENPQHEQ